MRQCASLLPSSSGRPFRLAPVGGVGVDGGVSLWARDTSFHTSSAVSDSLTPHGTPFRVVNLPGLTSRRGHLENDHQSSKRGFSSAAAAAASSSSASTSAVIETFPLPQTGEGIAECEVVQWFAEEGERIVEFGKLVEVQSDKATIEITSKSNGTLVKKYAQAGDVVAVGAPLCDIAVDAPSSSTAGAPQTSKQSAAQPPPPPPPLSPPPSPSSTSTTTVPTPTPARRTEASPAVRRVAKELDVDISNVVGTGPGGRVLKTDVEVFAKSGGRTPSKINAAPASPSPQPRREDAGTVVPLQKYQRAMAKAMEAAASVPRFTLCDDVDVTAMMVACARANAKALEGDIKLTTMPFVIKALSLALARYPELNVHYDADNVALIRFDEHRIGMAVATPHGLAVPTLRLTPEHSLRHIAAEVARLANDARNLRLREEDIVTPTVTVSNFGAIRGGSGHYASPVVVPPSIAIVAIGATRDALVPSAEDPTATVRRSLAPISWSADHRACDGAQLTLLNGAWKALCEEPLDILLAQ